MAGKKRPFRTFTKEDIAEKIAEKLDISQRRAYHLVNGVFQTVNHILCEANPEARIEIRGFGVIEVIKAAAKPAARNPKTNQIVYVPPHRRVRFKPGKALKEELKKIPE